MWNHHVDIFAENRRCVVSWSSWIIQHIHYYISSLPLIQIWKSSNVRPTWILIEKYYQNVYTRNEKKKIHILIPSLYIVLVLIYSPVCVSIPAKPCWMFSFVASHLLPQLYRWRCKRHPVLWQTRAQPGLGPHMCGDLHRSLYLAGALQQGRIGCIS